MKRSLTSAVLAFCLAATLNAQQSLEYSVVPAMSGVKRLADTAPVDGKKSAPLTIIAAKGEIESASFVLRSNKTVDKVMLKASDLKTADGKTIPASALDLKIVKIWYLPGTGWHSYFADSTGRTLAPELLLNDETLIKTDDSIKENYLRITTPEGETKYVWISNYVEIDVPLDTWKNRIADAPTLQPFRLDANAWKQIWVTVDAPVDAEGLYQGKINVIIDGKTAESINVSLRVLPFELPAPKTNYDLTRNFYASAYCNSSLSKFMAQNGKDQALAEQRLKAVYRNYKRHNLYYPLISPLRKSNPESNRIYRRQLEIYKEAGLGTDTIFDAVGRLAPIEYFLHKDRKLPLSEQTVPADWAKDVLEAKKIADEIFGKNTVIYHFGWDEPFMSLLQAQRKCWEFLHDHGMKIYTTGQKIHLYYNAYNEDFINFGGFYTREDSAAVHAMKSRIANYAEPHTGIENPDFVRRKHGLILYLQDFDATMNYGADGNGWNDFNGAEYNFRTFNWAFPGTIEPVNTLPFEAFREAIDDVRYATLLRQLAEKAINSGKTQNLYAGRQALQYLALLDAQKADLNTARLEMIRYILKLRNYVK